MASSYYPRSQSTYKPRSLRQRERRDKARLFRNTILVIVLLVACYIWGIPALTGVIGIFNHHPQSGTTKTETVLLAPPVLNIPYEATNSSSIRISGYSNPGNKVEVYIDDDLKTTVPVNDNGQFQTDLIDLSLGTNNIYGKTVDSSHQSLPSKTIQLTYSNAQPKLQVASPPDNSHIQGGDKKITVSGSTDPGNNISVNGLTVIVDDSGNFSTTIPINDGDNTITVIATNQVSNMSQVSVHVNYTQ